MKLSINGKEVEVSLEKLSEAIENKADTFEVKAEGIVIRSEEEEQSYKENVRKEGLGQGIEIGRKNVIQELGIEGEGLHKSDEKAIEAIKNWSSSQIEEKIKDLKKEPNQKIEELTNSLEVLKGTITNLEQEKQKYQNDLVNTRNTYKKKQLISKAIPDNLAIDREDMELILENKLKLEFDENGNIFGVGQDGNPIKDPKTADVVPADKIIQNFFNQNPKYLQGAQGGANGKDSAGEGGGKQDIDSFIKEMEEQGIQPGGDKFNQEMMKRQKAGELE